MSSPQDDDQDDAARRIKHGVKPGKSGNDDDEDQPKAADGSKGLGGLFNFGPRPPAPGSPKPPAPKPAVPSPAAPKPSTSAAPRPPKPSAPKPSAPKPPTSAAPKPSAPKPPTSAAPKPSTSTAPKPPKPAAPKPPMPGPAASAGSPGPTSAAGPLKESQSLGGSLTMKELLTLRIGGTAYVQQAGGKNLRLRNAPGLESTVLDSLAPGTRMTLLAGPRADDGYDWWQIRTDDGRQGWVAGSELVTQPED